MAARVDGKAVVGRSLLWASRWRSRTPVTAPTKGAQRD